MVRDEVDDDSMIRSIKGMRIMHTLVYWVVLVSRFIPSF